jgi:hypothetical protein
VPPASGAASWASTSSWAWQSCHAYADAAQHNTRNVFIRDFDDEKGDGKTRHLSGRRFPTMIHDAGGEIYACRATVDMFHLKKDDFCPEVDGVIPVG